MEAIRGSMGDMDLARYKKRHAKFDVVLVMKV